MGRKKKIKIPNLKLLYTLIRGESSYLQLYVKIDSSCIVPDIAIRAQSVEEGIKTIIKRSAEIGIKMSKLKGVTKWKKM